MNQSSRGSRRDVDREVYWRRTLEAHADSGLSVRAFCRRRGITESSFYFWRRELGARDAASGLAPSALVPVRVVEDAAEMPNAEHPAASSIEIVWSGGHRILVRGRVDRAALADVVAVLSSASSVEPLQGPELAEGEDSRC